jgi:hypothetical protein
MSISVNALLKFGLLTLQINNKDRNVGHIL